MLESILSIISSVFKQIGSATQRHKERALQFIKEASERAALRKKP